MRKIGMLNGTPVFVVPPGATLVQSRESDAGLARCLSKRASKAGAGALILVTQDELESIALDSDPSITFDAVPFVGDETSGTLFGE